MTDELPDALYTNGRILTMDPADRVCSAMVVRGGRIAWVGSAADADGVVKRGEAREVDLGGRVVIPGVVDAHSHLELTTTHLAYATQCFVPPHRTIADIGETLRQAAADGERGWIVGRSSFGLSLFVQDARPITRADIDSYVPDRPVAVFSGLHSVALNTAGLEQAGLLHGTATLPQGSHIDLETGCGVELWDWLPLPTFGPERVADAIRTLGISMFRSRGVTSMVELPFSHDGIHAYQQLWREGALPFRIDLRYHIPRICSIDDLCATGIEGGLGDDWLRIGGVKLFVDGVGADWEGIPGSDLKWSQDALDDVVGRCTAGRLQLMMHVQSDRSVDMALTAVERSLAAHPWPDHRHRIEHVADMDLGDAWWERIAAAGVVPVATPQFIHSYGDSYPESCGPRLRTLRERFGFRVPGNSDSTGSQPEAADPFHGVACAVMRTTRKGRVLQPDQALDVRDALRMFTADAAQASRMDDRGTLEPGKLADFVVLGDDPEQLPPDELSGMRVDLTVIGGVEHQVSPEA